MTTAAKELQGSRKRSIIIQKKRTSISMEDSFWQSLLSIVQTENISIGEFISKIPKKRTNLNLSSCVRVAVLDYYKSRSAAKRGISDEPRPGASLSGS